MPKPSSFWDERFAADEYIYGIQPNDFIEEGIEHLEIVEPILDEGMHKGPEATVRFVWRPEHSSD